MTEAIAAIAVTTATRRPEGKVRSAVIGGDSLIVGRHGVAGVRRARGFSALRFISSFRTSPCHASSIPWYSGATAAFSRARLIVKPGWSSFHHIYMAKIASNGHSKT